MRYCSKCGNELNDDQLYCPKCGNKEPFVTNSDKSDWKDFGNEKKFEGNVNYDFETKNVVDEQMPDSKQLPKSAGIINMVVKVFGIIACIYFVSFFIFSMVVLIKSHDAKPSYLYILNWASLGIFVVHFILQIIRIAILSGGKFRTHVTKQMFAPVVITTVIGICASIGQHFMFNTNPAAVLSMLQLIVMLGSVSMISGKKQKSPK